MDEKLLKRMAAGSFSLLVMVVMVSAVLSNYDHIIIYAGNAGLKSGSSSDQEVGKGDQLSADDSKNTAAQVLNNSIPEQLGDKYIIINKPDKSLYNVSLEDLYMDRCIRLSVTGLKKEVFNGTSVARVNQGHEFTGIPGSAGKAIADRILEETGAMPANFNTQGDKILIPEVISAIGKVSVYGTQPQEVVPDPVNDFKIEYSQGADGASLTAVITISLDYIYAPAIYQDEEYIYIDLRRPKDVYDKIVVIDAGHGGKDCGSFSKDQQYYEKDMNLGIVLKLKEILDREDMKVYYTRTDDKTLFLNPRVNFANEVEADLFISIHCNSNESSQPGGTEVLYNEKQPGDGLTSKRLAEIALEEITQVIPKVNRGMVPGSEMVVVGKAKVPVALIEVAFMSNQDDLYFLLQEGNKIKIAEAVHRIITRAFDEQRN
jgi:N-acetylmuramoyl-L-alanine amidase